MNRLTPRRRPQEAGTPLAMPARSRVKLVLHRGIVTGTIPERDPAGPVVHRGRAGGQHPPGP